ncbi:MAG: asparagine synthase (glutamine-hydrolyzing) [Candidatus Aenigmatarchaeota archaeon]|nr:MAG: asparagine synthase (glutamine-hydrolyzing) [Candidatus Aenigmarchaeota archaeon]
MCGISGFNWEDKELIKGMNKTLEHRGPDDHGIYTDRHVSLGHRRLAIIDLSERGKQPMSNENDNVWITYNGEVYNFKELRDELEKKGHEFKSNTDTEVIIHAYEEFGVNCLNRFNGMFAFCIYDSNKKILFLARDRIGIKPLYYYFDGNNFIFASEIKAILQYDIRRKINFNALNRFVMLRYIPEKETILKNIFRLLGGHYLIFDLKSKQIKIKRYWDITSADRFLSYRNSIKKLRTLLKDSVGKRLIADVPLGVYLSGGIDSSAIVAFMSQLNKGEIKTFSVGFESNLVNELDYARYVAEYFNTEHKEFILKSDVIELLPKIIYHLDEPLSDPAVIPNYLLSTYAKRSVSVILTGDGADELFAGYDQYKFLVWGKTLSKIPYTNKCIPFILNCIPMKFLDNIYRYSSVTGGKIRERFGRFINAIKENDAKAYLEIMSIFDEEERKQLFSSEIIHKIGDFNNYDAINRKYFSRKENFLNRIIKFDLRRYLPEDLLMKPDKMGMAHALEIRVPFLDHRIVDLSFRIPPNLKLNKFITTKYILKKSLSGILPKKIIYRKKQTFQLPMHEWIEKDLKHIFEEFLSKKKIEKQGFFKYSYIEKIFRNYEKSKLFYARQLWNLINFQIWYRIYIEGEKPDRLI